VKIRVLPEEVSVCRLNGAPIPPEWENGSGFFALIRNGNEVTVVCESRSVPAGVQSEAGWVVLETEGPLGFHLTGVLHGILQKLARVRISVFVVSTFSTDCVLVKRENLEDAIRELGKSYQIILPPGTAPNVSGGRDERVSGTGI
jgi:hypothetical protein